MGIYLKGLDLFPALVSRAGGMYEAEFFDIPGCRAYGATALEAEQSAGEALRAHADLLDRHGRSLPNPSAVKHSDRPGAYVAHIECPRMRPLPAGVQKAA